MRLRTVDLRTLRLVSSATLSSDDELALALELADTADAITMQRFQAADLRVDTKPDGSPVSDADRAVEHAIRERLASARPGHAVLGEEQGATGSATARWVLDPIDGTRNFVRGVPVWATLLSLQHDGAEVCAVVSAPALGRRWWAARGAGAHSDRGRLAVSGVSALSEAAISFTDVRDFANRGLADGFARLCKTVRTTRGFGDFWSHALVAEGAVDCGIEPRVSEWDISALRLIVREAGGMMTDLGGVDRLDGGNVVTSNGHIHAAVLAAFAQGSSEYPPRRLDGDGEEHGGDA